MPSERQRTSSERAPSWGAGGPPAGEGWRVAVLASSQERFARIVRDYLERPAGDYAELLHRGYVSSPEGVDADA